MAGKHKNDGGAVTISTSSRYGSHTSMIVSKRDDGTVICKDDFGLYTTNVSYIDSGMLDPNRSALNRELAQ